MENDTSLVTRRRSPFGSSMEAMYEDQIAEVYGEHNLRSAIDLLMDEGRENQETAVLPSLTSLSRLLNESQKKMLAIGDCWVCKHPNETVPCKFCEKRSCEMCVRQCERCCGVFCGICSTVDYTGRYDRAFCLTCHKEAKKAF